MTNPRKRTEDFNDRGGKITQWNGKMKFRSLFHIANKSALQIEGLFIKRQKYKPSSKNYCWRYLWCKCVETNILNIHQVQLINLKFDELHIKLKDDNIQKKDGESLFATSKINKGLRKKYTKKYNSPRKDSRLD